MAIHTINYYVASKNSIYVYSHGKIFRRDYLKKSKLQENMIPVILFTRKLKKKKIVFVHTHRMIYIIIYDKCIIHNNTIYLY